MASSLFEASVHLALTAVTGGRAWQCLNLRRTGIQKAHEVSTMYGHLQSTLHVKPGFTNERPTDRGESIDRVSGRRCDDLFAKKRVQKERFCFCFKREIHALDHRQYSGAVCALSLRLQTGLIDRCSNNIVDCILTVSARRCRRRTRSVPPCVQHWLMKLACLLASCACT